MKNYTLLVLFALVNFITTSLSANGIVRYYFDLSEGVFTNLQGKIFSTDMDHFLLPNEIVSNKLKVSLVKTDSQKWFGLSTHHIKTLAKHRGKVGFLMGFRNDSNGDCLRIICHFEQWPGLKNVPSSFTYAVKGVMFFPFIPRNPTVDFIALQAKEKVKVPYVYSKVWEKLPKYLNVALPCYVLWDGKRLVFGMSPQGPFFTINLEGREATFQRKFTKISEDGMFSYTSGTIGVPKSYKLSTVNVNVYDN